MPDSVSGVPPAGEPSATASPSPEVTATPSPDELQRLRAKLDLVTEDKRRAGEKNAELNRRLQELEESLRTTQAQLKDGQTTKLAESGEYKKLWEDAKETNLALERQISDLQAQLDAERQARATETLRSRALSEITAAKALRPDQLLSLVASDLREVEGKPHIIQGGIEVPLSDHLERLRAPNSGWEHHFSATGSRGMGSTPSTSAAAAARNPYRPDTFNLTEVLKLEAENPALAQALKAEAGIR